MAEESVTASLIGTQHRNGRDAMTDADGADWPPLDTANTSQNWESFKKLSAKYLTYPDASMQMVRPTDKEWSDMRDLLSPENEEVLRRRIERARADIDEYENKLSWLASLPDEPETPEDGDGPVIYFRKRFGDAERLEHEDGYQYAAVRSGDRWWVTGGRSRRLAGLTWRELLAFIYMGETGATSPVIWIAVGWDKL